MGGEQVRLGRGAFRVTHEVVGGALVVRALGKFDQEAGAAVDALLVSHALAGAPVLNLSGVEYISSSGVAALVKMSTARGVKIATPSPCVRDVLGLAGIERLLSIHADEEAARHAGA